MKKVNENSLHLVKVYLNDHTYAKFVEIAEQQGLLPATYARSILYRVAWITEQEQLTRKTPIGQPIPYDGLLRQIAQVKRTPQPPARPEDFR